MHVCLLLVHIVLPIAATHSLHVVFGPDDVHNLVPDNSRLAVLVQVFPLKPTHHWRKMPGCMEAVLPFTVLLTSCSR